MKNYSIALFILMCAGFAFASPPTLKTMAEYRGDSEQICAKKWTKRGELDQQMYNYCLGAKIDGYEALRIQVNQYGNQPFFAEVAYPYCADEGTTRGVADTELIVYCLNGEIEGWKDVEYFREQYGTAEVDVVVAGAMADYHSWALVAYNVKNHFE